MQQRIAFVTVFMLTACGVGDRDSSVVQNSSSFAPTMMGLGAGSGSAGPVVYYRLGETSGTIAANAMNTGLDGTYVTGPNSRTVALGRTGAVFDGNTAVGFVPGVSDGYVEVKDDRTLSLTRAWDNFDNRTVASGWGSTRSGDAWSAQVSGSQYLSVSNGLAVITPSSSGATYQAGLAVTLADGDQQLNVKWNAHAAGGPLQPAMIVARYVNSSNYVRAELRESTDTTLSVCITKVVNGSGNPVCAALMRPNSNPPAPWTYSVGDWWYLRFQYEGASLRAKAWPMDNDPTHTGTPPCSTAPCKLSYEPDGWSVTAIDSSPIAGTIAVRSSNSMGNARPTISFDGYWAQTVGMTLHFFWAPDANLDQLQSEGRSTPDGSGSTDHITQVLAKGYTNDANPHDLEYETRFIGIATGTAPIRTYDRVLKTYIFNLSGGLGAGVFWPWPAYTTSGTTDGPPYVSAYGRTYNYNPLVAQTSQFHEIVIVFDPGDYLDHTAGLKEYVDGVIFHDTSGIRCDAGQPTYQSNMYNGIACAGNFGQKGVDELHPEWQIVPVEGTRPLHLGIGDSTAIDEMHGRLDEVAIIPRRLTPDEIWNLYVTSQ